MTTKTTVLASTSFSHLSLASQVKWMIVPHSEHFAVVTEEGPLWEVVQNIIKTWADDVTFESAESIELFHEDIASTSGDALELLRTTLAEYPSGIRVTIVDVAGHTVV
jgi:hypothetical protein